MALLRIRALSIISTMKVLWPRASSSLAPTRAKMRSATPIVARRAGTKLPIWAISVISAVWRMNVLLPAMFGPVISSENPCSPPQTVSFGTNVPWAIVASSTGWRPSTISRTLSATTVGRQ